MVTSFRLIIVFFILSFLSIFSIKNLVYRWNENSRDNSLEISFSAYKTTPEETEQNITSKIENALSRIDNIESINSFSNDDNGTITISFNSPSNLSQKRFDILLSLRQVFDNLPAGTTFPIISQAGQGADQQPLLSFSLSGIDDSEISSIKTIFEKVFRNKDVPANIEVTGGSKKILQVEYDKRKLYSKNIQISDLISSLQRFTSDNYLGNVNDNGMNYFIKLDQTSSGFTALEQIVLKNNPLVKLKDIANITDEYEKDDYSYTINGKKTALIHIYDDQAENVLTTYSKVIKALEIIKEELPKGSELRLEQDNSKQLRELVRTTVLNAIITILLIFTILLLFKDWKYVLVAGTTIVINFCLLILIYAILKIPIDLITLNSISFILSLISFNLLVTLSQNNEISKRRIQQSQIIIFLIALSIHIGLNVLNNQDLNKIQSILKFSIIVLAIGIITNFLFATRLYKLLRKTSNNTVIEKLKLKSAHIKLRFRSLIFIFAVIVTGIPLFLLPSKIEGNEPYNKLIGSDLFQEKIIPLSNYLFGGIWRLFHENIYVNTEYEDSQETALNIYAEQPIGATTEQMKSSLEYLEKFISESEYVDIYVTQVHSGQKGSIRVKFLNGIPIQYPEQLRQKLINASQNLGGVGWTFYGIGKGFSNKMTKEHPSFQLKISGYNFAKLKEIGESVKIEISKNDRINNVSLGSESQFILDNNHEYKMSVNDRQLAQLQLEDKNIKSELIMNNSEIMDKKMSMNILNENIPIKITAKNLDKLTINEFQNHTIRLDERYIKPKSLIAFQKADRVESIIRENRRYIQVLNLKYVGSLETGYNYLLEETKKINKNLPEGYSIEVLNDHGSSKSFKTKSLVYLTVLAFSFILLTIRLNSFKKAGHALIMLYISISGIFSIFYFSDFKFDEGGQASFLFSIIVCCCFLLYFWEELSSEKKTESNAVYLNHNITFLILSFLIMTAGILPYLITQPHAPFWPSFTIGLLGSYPIIALITIFFIPIISIKKIQINEF